MRRRKPRSNRASMTALRAKRTRLDAPRHLRETTPGPPDVTYHSASGIVPAAPRRRRGRSARTRPRGSATATRSSSWCHGVASGRHPGRAPVTAPTRARARRCRAPRTSLTRPFGTGALPTRARSLLRARRRTATIGPIRRDRNPSGVEPQTGLVIVVPPRYEVRSGSGNVGRSGQRASLRPMVSIERRAR
jgi:hypothetical protein